ncbi:MAG: helix-turn-helix domain-containing protein [Caulobacter sp.]
MQKSVFSDAHAAIVEMLIALRKERGVSQGELAARIGRSQQIVSYIERGDRRIDVVEFCEIVLALEGDPAALIASVIEPMRRP